MSGLVKEVMNMDKNVVEKEIDSFQALAVHVVLIWKKELVCRYVITGNKLLKDLQARLFSLVLGEVTRGYEQVLAHYLVGLLSWHPRRLYRFHES